MTDPREIEQLVDWAGTLKGHIILNIDEPWKTPALKALSELVAERDRLATIAKTAEERIAEQVRLSGERAALLTRYSQRAEAAEERVRELQEEVEIQSERADAWSRAYSARHKEAVAAEAALATEREARERAEAALGRMAEEWCKYAYEGDYPAEAVDAAVDMAFLVVALTPQPDEEGA